MTLSSSNEPTEGTGGSPVVDTNGEFVGRISDMPVPSEDIARVAIQLDPAAKTRHDLQVDFIDVEASWLELDDATPDRLVLNRPLDEALAEQGFNMSPEVPGRDPAFARGARGETDEEAQENLLTDVEREPDLPGDRR